MTHFVEKELQSNQRAYKIFQIFQNKKDVDPNTRDWSNDLFDHNKYSQKEAKLSQIPCPIRGTKNKAPEKVEDLQIVDKPRLIDVDPMQDEPSRGVSSAQQT